MSFIPAVPNQSLVVVRFGRYLKYSLQSYLDQHCVKIGSHGWSWAECLSWVRRTLKKVELEKAIFVGKATRCCYWRSSRGNTAACTRAGHMHCFKINIYINGTLRNFIIVWHKREFSTQHSCNLLMGSVCSELGVNNTSASPHGCCWVLSRPYDWCGWCYLPCFACGGNRSPVRFRQLAEIEH